jgi:hypothetical protein
VLRCTGIAKDDGSRRQENGHFRLTARLLKDSLWIHLR